LRLVYGELELLLAEPEGAGVDAAFASVVLRDLYRRIEPERGAGEPAEVARALLTAYDDSPLGRPVELLLVRISSAGRVRGVAAGLRPPSLVVDGRAQPIATGEPLPVSARRLVGQLRQFAASLDGRALILFDDGMPESAPRRLALGDALARMAAAVAARGPQAAADEAIAAAVKQYRKKHSDDFFALTLVAG
jgi:hypothetical protein